MKADIFFFISSIAVVVVSIVITVACYFVICSLRRIERFAERVEERMSDATEEVKGIGDDIKKSFLYNLIFKKKKQSKLATTNKTYDNKKAK